MSTRKGVDPNNTSVARPTAGPSALGFLGRGIRSVTSLFSSVFASSTASASDVSDDEEPATLNGTQASDSDNQVQDGSSSEDGHSTTAHGNDSGIGSDEELPERFEDEDEQADGADDLAPQQQEPVQVLVESTGPSVNTTGPLAPAALENPRLSSSLGVNAAPGPRRDRAPLRREGAFYGIPPPPVPAPAPRPRGQLRREPVWIDGVDPSEMTPASELRGRDSRTVETPAGSSSGQAPRRGGQLRREPVWIDGVDPTEMTPASEPRGNEPRNVENRADSSTRQAPRRGGQLRREPVWIDGVDPSEMTPASELRGTDPRYMETRPDARGRRATSSAGFTNGTDTGRRPSGKRWTTSSLFPTEATTSRGSIALCARANGGLRRTGRAASNRSNACASPRARTTRQTPRPRSRASGISATTTPPTRPWPTPRSPKPVRPPPPWQWCSLPGQS
ncbi:hypothetical protein BD413DRAFT_169297 [Trametes elegans]|nr:hypothetical protein BD413DRAFT_169297 [Trametes elegans]